MSKPPSNSNGPIGLNGRICVPAWLFVLLVVIAAGVNVAAAFLPATAVCP